LDFPMTTDSSQFDSILQKILTFRDARDWKKYHIPRNLAISIAIEAAEILELFQWNLKHNQKLTDGEKVALAEELADVMILCFLLAHECDIDPYKAIIKKIEKNALKYPKERPELGWQNKQERNR
ncbi:MAG: nucleotide pyrophosphohydrolase, partial [Candidatus Hodarchaeota archaeon]